MASALYDIGRQGFLDGSVDWDTDDIRVIGIDVTDYTVDLALHQDLADVPVAARVFTTGTLLNPTATDGVADADDITATGVSGDPVDALVIYQHTGTESTSTLIAYIDGFSPVTPNGGDIGISWDDGANKIFKL